MAQQDLYLENLESRLKSLEHRIAILESERTDYRTSWIADENSETREPFPQSINETLEEEKGIEGRIGRTGLAWLGNIVLLIGVLFFTEYLITQGHRLLSFIIGILAVGAVLLASGYLKKTNHGLAFMLWLNSQIILFYEVMRTNFFSPQPLIQNKVIVLLLLLAIVAIQIYNSIKNKYQVLGVISVIMILFTGILSDTTHSMLSFTTLAGMLAVYFFYRMRWLFLILSAIVFVYISFFLWLYGNPFMGHTLQIIPEHNNGHLYLFALGACFSVLPLICKPEEGVNEILVSAIILNGSLFTLILSLVSTKFFSSNYVLLFSIITLFCLSYSVILKYYSAWKFSSAFYALYGFLAMSISLYGLVGIPRVYLLLSVQSFIVVIMALWFRNRIMIVMNSMLFISILLFYMLSSKPVDGVNFSFALVPLISARIINWQKDRLDIKTEYIRNLYLIVAFFMVLYALYHGLPEKFVTLSWTMAALIYFLLSFILKNIKYRYMALGTMICAAIYLLAIDLASIEIIYRVLALLFLAVVSIGISIFYSKSSGEKKKDPPSE